MYKKKKAVRATILAALLLAVAVLPARATTFARLELPEMARLATKIVQARAVESHAEWNADRTSISTYTTFEVLDSLKGSIPGERIVVKQLGGKVGHLIMKVHGEPHFQPGDETILFLDDDAVEPTMGRIVGMAQGNYRIVRDGATQERFVVSTTEGASVFDPRTRSFSTLAERLRLEEFKQEVRELLGGEPGVPEGTPEPRNEK
jgi:hypothetical protein